MQTHTLFLNALLSLACLYAGTIMATEEPRFTVTSKASHYEIRQYQPTLIAETEVDTEFAEAGQQGFKILGAYIFGNNKSTAKIAMTVPVAQKARSEKIAMTVPVTQTERSEKIAMAAPLNQIKSQHGFVVQFTMPANFTQESLPIPNDKRIKIRKIPARKLAVYSYSGSWSKAHYQTNLNKFMDELKKDGVSTTGKPVFARFNSPFQLWFLRRNEIWLEITP